MASIFAHTTRRWSSSDDRHFWAFTYAKGERAVRWGVMLDSGGEDDDWHGCHIRFYLGRHTVLMELPNWLLRPRVIKAGTPSWYGVQKYDETFCREYGFNFFEGSLHVHYGPQTHDSESTKSKCFFYPWHAQRLVRHVIYDADGALFAEGEKWVDYKVREACPTVDFAFKDYDGEDIVAKTRIEERTYVRWEGRFKWLSRFCRRKTHRSLELSFTKEVGPRKGSWKGGTVGHSTEMQLGETREDAFRRYCGENRLTFVGGMRKDVEHG